MARIVKKYNNRRLYDTEESRYVTLEELVEFVRGGSVRVIDAKSGEDLTQATLVQIVLETSAAKFLPVHLLEQLIRMQDDALAEFFQRYVSAALDLYLAAKRGAQQVAPLFPFATLPFTASNALARAISGMPFFGDGPPPAAYAQPGYAPQHAAVVEPPPPPAPPSAAPVASEDLADLRRELDELKRELGQKKKKRSPG